MKHLVFPPKGSVDQPVWVQEFGPAEDRNSIVVVDQTSWTHRTPRTEGIAFFGLAIRSGGPSDKVEVESRIAGEVRRRQDMRMDLVEAAIRPCDRLPPHFGDAKRRDGAENSLDA